MGINHSIPLTCFNQTEHAVSDTEKKQKRTICFKRYLLADRGGKEEKSQERNTTHLPSSRQNAGEGGLFHMIITVDVESDDNLHSQTIICLCGTHVGLSGLFFCGKMQSWIASLVCNETMHHRNSIFWGLAPLRRPLTTTFAAAMSIKRGQAFLNKLSRLFKVKKKKKCHLSWMVPLTLEKTVLLLVEIQTLFNL